MAKLKIKYKVTGNIPDEFLETVKQNNTSETIAKIKQDLDNNYGSDLVDFESDLQVEIIDEKETNKWKL